MKYYIIFKSNELSVIGDYPQVEKLETYNLSSPNSYWNVSWNQIPDFKPNYEIKIRNKAKPTNFLHSLSGFHGLTIDDNFKNIIEKFNLSPHRFYPIKVIHLNRDLKYYWFHFIDSFLNYVDFDSTTFELYHKSPFNILKELKVSSVEILNRLKRELNFEKDIRIKRLVLNSDFPCYDVVSLRNITPIILVSEKLKNSLEKSKLNGFQFREYDKIIINSSLERENTVEDKKFIEYSKPQNSMSWSDFRSTLDALQIASGQTYGKKKINELLNTIKSSGSIVINKQGKNIVITNNNELQDLINTYDPNIKLTDIC